jgi:hypothetical protein
MWDCDESGLQDSVVYLVSFAAQPVHDSRRGYRKALTHYLTGAKLSITARGIGYRDVREFRAIGPARASSGIHNRRSQRTC